MSKTPIPKILAVDDRRDNLVALAAVLDPLPVEVVPATSGQAALRELLTEEFALILLDVVMPGMDGYETAAQIKHRLRTRDIPIIFLTTQELGHAQAFHGYTAGAADFLYKPFDPWMLRAKVSVFVDLYRKNLQVARLAETVERLGAQVAELRVREGTA